MGKILTYLKISEDNQSRDVLDAERLLEGMQAIYATSPSGSKKDNFAIPLAEMTKIFIEKVKGIAPKEEPKEEPKQELNFKVGDVFKQAVGDEYEKDYGISTFTILSIDEKNNNVNIGRKDLKTLKTLEFERAISKVFDDVDTNWWIPYENKDTFKVGDMFYVTKEGKEKTYQVIYIDGQNFTFVRGNDGNIESYEGLYSTDEANLKLKEGRWTKVDNQKEAPKDDQTQFKIGDKYLNKTVKDTFTITQVYTDFIDVKFSGGNEATYDMLLCKEKVADGTWVKVLDEEKEEQPKSYKVGDRFLWAKEDITFVIDFIKNGELGIIYSDGLTGFLSTEQFEKGLSTGYYKPYTEEAKPEEKKPRKPRQPRTKSEQDKKIEHILDINLDEIQF